MIAGMRRLSQVSAQVRNSHRSLFTKPRGGRRALPQRRRAWPRYLSTGTGPPADVTHGKEAYLAIQKMLDEDPLLVTTLANHTSTAMSVQLLATVTRVQELVAKQATEVATAPPSMAQLKGAFISSAIPFVGFGIIDNAIMILVGDYIDMSLGVSLGISTMAAAGLGNLTSDVAGVWAGSWVEKLVERLGFTAPLMSRQHMKHKWTKKAQNYGAAIGVSVGCLIGMFPLLFMDSGGTEVTKQKKQVETLFNNVFKEVGGMLDAEGASLFLVDEEKQKMYSYTVVKSEERNASEVKPEKYFVPFDRGLVGACARAKRVINVHDVRLDPRFYAEIDAQTGFHTKSILTMPMFGANGEVIGVVEVVNKRGADGTVATGYFTLEDEQILRSICSHIGLAVANINNDQKQELLEALKIVKTHHDR